MKVWQLLFSKRKSSGIFVPDGKGGFEEYNEPMEGNGSIDSIAKHFGYTKESAHTYYNFTRSQLPIREILLKTFTKEIICVLADERLPRLDSGIVEQLMQDFDEEEEYNYYNIEYILSEGIKAKTLTVDFLGDVLDITNPPSNGACYTKQLGAYLYFVNGTLVSFKWDSPLLPYPRHVRKLSPNLFKSISLASSIQWTNKQQIDYEKVYQEVNIQLEALHNIPQALSNQYIHLHTADNGYVNFHMLLVCHYNTPIIQKEFEELNHGRFHQIAKGTYTHYRLGHFSYVFDSKGNLLEIYSYLQGIKALHLRNS